MLSADVRGCLRIFGGTMHLNTIWLMAWADRMTAKHGNPDSDNDWCRKLAYHVGEAGNDHPSNNAIAVAKQWEAEKP